MVGKLKPELFPAVFGPNQDQRLDAAVVAEKFEGMAQRIGDGRDARQVAEGFLTIAVENMANAIKKISVQRGYDVSTYLLNSFGGAGGQHACLVADALSMERVLIHPMSGLLSAYGIGLSSLFSTRSQALVAPLEAGSKGDIDALADGLGRQVEAELTGQDVDAGAIDRTVLLQLRYDGTDTTLPVPYDGDLSAARKLFEAGHKAQFGFIYENRRWWSRISRSRVPNTAKPLLTRLWRAKANSTPSHRRRFRSSPVAARKRPASIAARPLGWAPESRARR